MSPSWGLPLRTLRPDPMNQRARNFQIKPLVYWIRVALLMSR